MKKLIFTASILLLAISLFAQPTVDAQMIQKIKDEEKTNSQITMIAHNITDVCGPRLTNSPGYKRALAWVTQTLKSWGLQNAGPEAWGNSAEAGARSHLISR